MQVGPIYKKEYKKNYANAWYVISAIGHTRHWKPYSFAFLACRSSYSAMMLLNRFHVNGQFSSHAPGTVVSACKANPHWRIRKKKHHCKTRKHLLKIWKTNFFLKKSSFLVGLHSNISSVSDAAQKGRGINEFNPKIKKKKSVSVGLPQKITSKAWLDQSK